MSRFASLYFKMAKPAAHQLWLRQPSCRLKTVIQSATVTYRLVICREILPSLSFTKKNTKGVPIEEKQVPVPGIRRVMDVYYNRDSTFPLFFNDGPP